MNDEKIISLYFERNEEAVSASDEKYGKYCFAVANNILESEEDSKECVNDTWLRAWNSIPPAKPSVLKLFFAKITRNLAFDKYEKSHTKKRESFASLLSELEECIPSVTDTESEYSSKELGSAITYFLASVSFREKNFFIERYYFGNSVKQIAKKHITEKYYRYLKTSFKMPDPYRSEFEHLIDSGESFAAGPYLDVTDAFKKGKSISELILEGILPSTFSKIHMNLERPLYLHQEKAIRKIASEHKNLVVSTGTGSGKTESFLIPVLRELTMEAEAGTLCPGVRALLIYPMNALANDQTERLRGLLAECPEITFGVYTGQTKQKKEDALAEYKALNQNQSPIVNELISRDEMVTSPPHILITNYAMLEYLMLRPRDSVFFDGDGAKHWKFIVFDEAHVYNGSTGIEVSMLFRRLKAKLGAQDITYILTSATLGEKEDDAQVAEFAQKLCNAPFSAADIVRADRIMPIFSAMIVKHLI